MNFRRLRLRSRRLFRKQQKQVESLSAQTEQQIEKHVVKRFGRLSAVRRFVISWLLLVLLLIGGMVGQNIALSNYFQTVQPVPGGIYKEGVLGSFTNANPMYATSNADATVSRLVFAGLLKHDVNNKLVGELATGYTTDANGLTYTLKLKPNLSWQDGQPLTSADVVYTFQTIQNPDAQSPLKSSWQGIEVTAPDPHTVVFTLPSPLAAFPYNLTTGIVPKHILSKIAPADLRSAEFNTVSPIGAGPFVWQAIEVKGSDPKKSQQQIALLPFEDYILGEPKLSEFIVYVYADQQQLLDSFSAGKITAIEGLNSLPKKITNKPGVYIHDLPLNAANMVFFKTTNGILADKEIRKALVQAADVPKIISKLSYPARMVNEPILQGQAGYDPTYAQAGFDLPAAKQRLDAAGWKAGANGVRQKDNKRLTFKLAVADTPESRMVASQLQQQWKALGVDMQIDVQKPSDFQSTLSYHSYDAVLYGITIGSDPDVFVYWASSQADVRSGSRLNLSEYKNSNVDTALEAGRTRRDPALRTIKYRPFLQAWQQDAPALGLYQPRLLHATNGPLFGLSDHSIDSPVGRLNNVHNWQIRQAKVTNE